MEHIQAVAVPKQPGDFFFCSWQFNLYVGIFVVSILARSPEKRHAVFKWLITILASVFVVSGTMLRIGWGVWQDIDIGLGKNRVERYFILSLVSWIGCIVMDGYLILNIFRAYHGSMKKSMKELVWDFCTNWTAVQTAEKVGLLISLASMINLGIDVYCSFNNLTSDVSLYVYFTLCVMCKIGRILAQGLVVTVDAANLVTRWNLISHLLVSHFFLTVQIVFLAQFNPDQLCISLSLMTGDAVYRVCQCVKINYYCCCADRHDQYEIPIQEDILNSNITTRCFVPTSQHTILTRDTATINPVRCINEDTIQDSSAKQSEQEVPEQEVPEPRSELPCIQRFSPPLPLLLKPPIKPFYHPPPHNSTPLLLYDICHSNT